MKFFKVLLLILAVVLIGLIITAGVSYYQLRGRPEFYKAYEWNSQQRAAINQQAVNKVSETHNRVARTWSKELQSRRNGATTRADDYEPMTVSFTEEELNAVLAHNENFRKTLDAYVTDPGIYLRDGQIILAGLVKELGYVVSFHFEPKLDDQGQLHLTLAKTMGGRLPLPRAMLESKLDKVRDSLKRRLPRWQQDARIDPAGAANSSAVAAAMSKLLLSALDNQPADPLLFLPEEQGRSLPLRLNDILINDKSLSLTVQPMTPTQREAMFHRLKDPPSPVASADAAQAL